MKNTTGQSNGHTKAEKAAKQDSSTNEIVVDSEQVTIERKGIFSIVREDKAWFVALKNHRVSAIHDTREKAIADCTNITWDRITQVILILTDNEKQFTNEHN